MFTSEYAVAREFVTSCTHVARYTKELRAAVRRQILAILPGGLGVPPRDVVDALFMHPAGVVERELRWIAGRPNAPAQWNGKRGQGSRYFRVRS
jgi:hypothetical protein